MRWRLWLALGAGLILSLFSGAVALGENQGTDVFQNIAPKSDLGGSIDRYPLSAYGLDYHVDPIDVNLGFNADVGDVPAWTMQFMTKIGALLLLWAVRLVIEFFSWAFSVDLLTDKVLEPLSQVVQQLHNGPLGGQWLSLGILLFAAYAIKKGLAEREHNKVGGAVVMMLVASAIALAFINAPKQTMGKGAEWANGLSLAVLGIPTDPLATEPRGAEVKQAIGNHLFDRYFVDPWKVLQFGGLRHCVDMGRRDADGFPKWVDPYDPTRDICRDHQRYADAYLQHPVGSDERTKVYEAIRDGEAPWDKADSSAVDIQQASLADQRLGTLALIGIGLLFPLLLLGWLALATLAVQLVAMFLWMLAPIMVILALIPGRGHSLFWTWLQTLGVALFVKVLFAIALGSLVTLSRVVAGSGLPWLQAFILVTALFAILWACRKMLLGGLFRNKQVRRTENKLVRQTETIVKAVAAPIDAYKDHRQGKQESALKEGRGERVSEPSYSTERASEATSSGSPTVANPPVERAPQGSAVGGSYSAARPATSSPRPASQEQTMSEKPVRIESFSKQTLDRARTERVQAQQEAVRHKPVRGVPTSKPDSVPPAPRTFEDELERERAKKPAKVE